jgi:phytoene dehydrogenase-like protein
MTLAERCTATKIAIDNRNAKHTEHGNSKGLRERTTVLQGIRGTITTNLALIEVLKRHGIKLNKVPPVATAKSTKAQYLATLATAPIETGKEHGQFRRSVQKVSDDLAAALRDALASIERELPSSDETFLRQVELLPQYKATVEEIRRRRQELLGGRSIHDRAPSELDDMLFKREQLRELANSLLPEEFPKAVLEFYKWARRKEGAALDLLTPEVREWLAPRKLLQNVRLFIKD